MTKQAARRASGSTALFAFVIPALCAAAPMTAQAQGMNDLDQFDLVIEGSVESACSLGTTGGTVDIGRLNQGQTNTRTFSLPLTCNTPFSLAITSKEGGLVHERMAGGQGPFAGRLGYTTEFEIPVKNAGATNTARRTFTSAQLRNTSTYRTGANQISDGDVKVTVKTDPITGDGLLAGAYADVLTITIATGV